MPLLLAYDLLGKVQVTLVVGSRGGPLRWGSRSFGLIASVQWIHRELALGGQLHQRNKGARERAGRGLSSALGLIKLSAVERDLGLPW